MRKLSLFLLPLALAIPPHNTRAQGALGAVDFQASVTPTEAKPEPVRGFTFYVLTRSYEDIVKRINEEDAPPQRDKFIDTLKISPQLKKWLHAHDVMDLALPGVDKLLTADDILNTPEFLLAYQRSNSGGVTHGIPVPRYKDADKKDNPERYEKQHQEYMTALKKFIQEHPESVSGIELELDAVNPARKWAELQNEQKRRVRQLAPAEAQIKYLAAKVDTDLEGHAAITGLPAGKYWISSLNLYAESGDVRLRWDVPITVEKGQTIRLQLSNLNAVGAGQVKQD
ncbi:MAG TPA: hypothetical protein VLV88_03735 [Terriglobales bacterium]|nr:hypothetical protein [Terriglobales bacterium]